MPEDRLDHIHSEMVDPANDMPAMATEAPQEALEPVETLAPDDDSQGEAQAALDGSEAEQEPDDAQTKRIARLANDVREKNRKLAEKEAEIQRLKGLRTETRDHELDRLADERAEQKMREKEFVKSCHVINQTGIATYGPDFRKAVDAMNDVCNDPIALNILLDGIIEAAGPNEGHAIIKHFGDNVDILEDIVAMPPHRQGAALAKLAVKLSAPKAKPVSKAPAPLKTVSTSTASTGAVDPMKMSMEEFAKWSLKRDIERGKITLMSKKHPGFNKVASKIERKEGVSKEEADAMLAGATRHDSGKAKKANPKLNKVKGK